MPLSKPSEKDPSVSYEEALVQQALQAVESPAAREAFQERLKANPRDVTESLSEGVLWAFAASEKPENKALFQIMARASKAIPFGSMKQKLIVSLLRNPGNEGTGRVFARMLEEGHLDGRWTGSFIEAADEARLRNALSGKDYFSAMALVGRVLDRAPEAMSGISDGKIGDVCWMSSETPSMLALFASMVHANPNRVVSVLSSRGASEETSKSLSSALYALAASEDKRLRGAFEALMNANEAAAVKAVKPGLSLALMDDPKDGGAQRVFETLSDRGCLGSDWMDVTVSNVEKIYAKGHMSADRHSAFLKLTQPLVKRPGASSASSRPPVLQVL